MTREHDPLCPMREPDPGDTVRQSSCECYLIAQVRADERERIARDIERERDQVGMVAGASMSHGLLRAARIARRGDALRAGSADD